MTKFYFLFILLLSTIYVNCQPINRFSKTYPDTMRLDALPGNCFEIEGEFYISSGGGGLNLQQGSYCQIIKVDQSGNLLDRFFVFDTTRSNSSSPPMLRSENGDFIITLGESIKNTYYPRGIIVNRLSSDFDTIWQYRNSDST
jgi:hypothetical protein